MVIKRFTRILVVLSIVYFQAMFMSQLFFHLGTTSDLGMKRRMLKMSHYFMPLDHYPSYEYAYSYLDKGVEIQDRELLAQGIEWFDTSLFINPFYYYSHYYQGKAYYFYHTPAGDYFDDSFGAMKKAALLNRHDGDIVVDLTKIALPMWPHLPEQDRTLCLDLLRLNIDKLSRLDFKSVVESWRVNSNDIDILRRIMEGKSQLYGKTGNVLAEVGGSLNLRWEFLAGYEQYVFDDIRNRLRSLSFVEDAAEVEYVALLRRFDKIEGYGILTGGGVSRGTEFDDLLSDLMLKRIKAFLQHQIKPLGQRARQKLSGLARRYIERLDHFKQLEDLRLLLNEYSYFNGTDIDTKFVGFFLEFKQSNFSSLISNIEEFRAGVSHIGDDGKRRYLDILLLLADSLEASKLLSVGNRTIQGILNEFPSEPAVAWRLMKIWRILGFGEKGGTLDPLVMDKIRKNNVFTLDLRPVSREVMFLENSRIIVTPSPELDGAQSGNTVVRLFLDHVIAREFYLKDLRRPMTLEIPGKEYSRVDVRIDFLVFNNSTVL